MVDELEEPGPTPDDRRQHDRARIIVDVFYDGQDLTGVASTSDISVGGLFMNTKANLPDGCALLLRIPFPEGKQVIVNAEVVYSNPGSGVGVSFQGLSSADRALLESELGRD